ncbi:hypothetical protein [Cryptosporangium sp. NPDC048952]|uniref:hypothetical protein n=1 Tax=Cryptosporangium sp. NPDC048952 TaxID=3363961 RepID=UPI0037156C96
MADLSGVYPVLPPIESPARPAETLTVEDEVLASWLDILVADGLVPPRAVLGNSY